MIVFHNIFLFLYKNIMHEINLKNINYNKNNLRVYIIRYIQCKFNKSIYLFNNHK